MKKYLNYANHTNRLKAIYNIHALPLDVCNIIVKYAINQKTVNHVLLFISQMGIVSDLDLLHKNGADIRIYNYLSIRLAASHGHLDVVKYLHKAAQSPGFISAKNNYAIRYALKNGHVDVVNHIISAKNNQSIRYASENGHLEVVKYLHKNGADITAQNNYALRFATENGHFEVVKYILSHVKCCGVNIHADDNNAFRRASKNGYFKIMKLLHIYGASVYNMHNHPLGHASMNGHLEIVDYILQHLNPDIMGEFPDLNELIFWAERNGHSEVVQCIQIFKQQNMI
jgi:ankyrin repeat protein